MSDVFTVVDSKQCIMIHIYGYSSCVMIVVHHIFMDVFLYMHVINANIEIYIVNFGCRNTTKCNEFKFMHQKVNS